MQKNLKVIKSMLLTAPAVTNKAANEKKNCPCCLFPKHQPSLRKSAVTNDTFHLSNMPLLRL